MTALYSRSYRILPSLLFSIFILSSSFRAFSQVTTYSLPPQVKSSRYSVTINGKPTDVASATLRCHFVSCDFTDSVEINVTVKDPGYWKNGAEIRPFSKGFYPEVNGNTVTFTIKEPCKLSLERRGRTNWRDEVLYIFANAPEENAPDPAGKDVVYLGPGYHERNIDLQSNQTLYLHGGAVLKGSVNIWNAQNVNIAGRGWIIHKGKQSPKTDEAAKQIPNWHPVTAFNVKGLTVRGVVMTARSRTWTIQTTETFDLTLDNVKIITGARYTNGDGLDMYGGGNVLVKDCFMRGTDDMFAFYHEWWGNPRRLPEIKKFKVTGCVFWPSQANVIRIGWGDNMPAISNFTMRDCDIIHMRKNGNFHFPFALLTIWGKPDKVTGDARFHDFLFEDIRFDHGVALTGIQLGDGKQELRNFRFKNIHFLDRPDLGSVLSARMDGVTIENLRYSGHVITDRKKVFKRVSGVKNLKLLANGPNVLTAFMCATKTEDGIVFDASSSILPGGKGRYSARWNLGDGNVKEGMSVNHSYSRNDPDRVVSLVITCRDGTRDFTYARLKSLFSPKAMQQ